MTSADELIEGVHPDVARVLRAKSGMERLRLAHETWQLVRDRLAAFLASRHPDWPKAEIDRAVAGRLLGDSGRAAPISR